MYVCRQHVVNMMFLFIQIWTFLRTDVDHNKMRVMAIRPELMSLRPSSRAYMQKVLSSPDIGLKSARKDFLDMPTTDMFNTVKKVRRQI